jgi:hypothetical protein
MRNDERKRIWIDRFQTKITLRIGAYLAVFLIVLNNFLFAWQVWKYGGGDPSEQYRTMLQNYAPVALCMLLLVPVMAWDALRFSHRLIGPLVRFRQAMQSVARGEPIRPIKLRKGDHLIEFQDDFNAMLQSLQQRGVAVLKPNDPAAMDSVHQETA